MFWSKNKNTDKQKKANNKKASGRLGGQTHQNSSSDKSQRLRNEALANARRAREQIGEETLDKIAALMTKKQQSSVEQSKKKIAEADAGRVAQEILYMIEDKH